MARWNNVGGHRQRQLNAAHKAIPDNSEYIGIEIYGKGDWRGVLARYENCFIWEVYTDPDYQQHLDWNRPESKLAIQDKKVTFFEIDDYVKSLGFEYLRSIS